VIDELKKTSYEAVLRGSKPVYYLNDKMTKNQRRSFKITDASLIDLENESLDLLENPLDEKVEVHGGIDSLIEQERLINLNTSYENWLEWATSQKPMKWRLNILGLGDVGGTLATGLKLLGADYIDRVGIYDRDTKRLNRWEKELNQIKFPFRTEKDFRVEPIDYDQLFDCDMFIFCASRFIPEVGSGVKDVRMAQFESNAEIIKEYAKLARNNNFNGIFAVVSDPVDLLCKCVYIESNKDNEGNYNANGLAPDQIRGYGLGVMNARACYYAEQRDDLKHYLQEGRAYGPHGKDLIVADSISNYNHENSLYLTDRTIKANLEVRDAGYKPFIAPALSSGAISLIATISGEWHYSATFIDGAYMGSKNRFVDFTTELERVDMPEELKERIKNTHVKLKEII